MIFFVLHPLYLYVASAEAELTISLSEDVQEESPFNGIEAHEPLRFFQNMITIPSGTEATILVKLVLTHVLTQQLLSDDQT